MFLRVWSNGSAEKNHSTKHREALEHIGDTNPSVTGTVDWSSKLCLKTRTFCGLDADDDDREDDDDSDGGGDDSRVSLSDIDAGFYE